MVRNNRLEDIGKWMPSVGEPCVHLFYCDYCYNYFNCTCKFIYTSKSRSCTIRMCLCSQFCSTYGISFDVIEMTAVLWQCWALVRMCSKLHIRRMCSTPSGWT